jgi:hypothetical protein
MNTKLVTLKNGLKEIAAELKINKPEFRKQQSKISKENIKWFHSEEEKSYLQKHYELDIKNDNLKEKFRHYHIAYCLLRGKKYEQIENKVREGNQPNWGIIDKIKEEYSEAN